MNKLQYSIANEYSKKPGPRYVWQGSESGEHFLKNVLTDLFENAVKENLILVVDLDKTSGYGPSFLEESFGGLARLKGITILNKHLSFVSNEEPYLISEIWGYINYATQH